METKKKIYLYFCGFVIFTLFFAVWFVPHFLRNIRENSENLIFLRQELISLRREKESLDQLRTIYQARQQDLTKINQLFVDPEVPIDFIDFLEKTAQISQQKIDISLIPPKGTKEEPWPHLSFQISTLGSFPDFFRFLEKLENSPYLIEILNLDIRRLTKAPEGFSVGDVKSSFLIKVFTQK